MKMLYTANGRYIRCCTEEGTRPVIIVCEKEYEVDVQEFMLWSILNWRILREEEIGSYYEKMANNTNVTIHRSWQDCVQRLLVRGLIVAGTGDTEYDALYDLLACRFIVPIGAAWPLRVLSFLKLTEMLTNFSSNPYLTTSLHKRSFFTLYNLRYYYIKQIITIFTPNKK